MPLRADPTNAEDPSGHSNMAQLIQLRWFAVIGQVMTIALVHFAFGIALPLFDMLAVLALLAAFNIASHVRWRERHSVTNGEIFLALLVDVGTLTALLYFSGGASNPFSFLYLLQVTIGAVLLEAWSTWTMVVITSVCFAGLTTFFHPLALARDAEGGLSGPYVQGTLVCFALNAALLVTFITRINRNLRGRDARLAALRQRAAEEEHIVRMGLLASGAAHELGTPLSTLSVILGDWRRMRPFSADPDLLQEVVEMQAQVTRCKSIVGGILLSAGEARGESPVETTLRTFLDELVAEWRGRRPAVLFHYNNKLEEDLPIVSDSALKQMISNVLDNAFEASPQWLGFDAEREADELLLRVTDAGPGFAPEMLAEFGKPYRSTKGRPGGGLGLFLVSNVARTLHGSVSAQNRPQGGAIVEMRLPLASIMLEEIAPDGR